MTKTVRNKLRKTKKIVHKTSKNIKEINELSEENSKKMVEKLGLVNCSFPELRFKMHL